MGNPRTILFVLLPLLWLGSLSPAAGAGPPRAFWLQGRIVAAIPPLANEGYIQMAQRVMEDPSRYQEIIAFNNKRPMRTGRNVRFPVVLLKPEIRGGLLRALYPDDELTERGWAHNVTDPLESLIQLTLAYTGSKRHFKELARYNGIKNPNRLRLGDTITIPLNWIPEELGLRPVAVKGPLGLEADRATGRSYATYTLLPNETLYSVLLRFTDREHAAELRRMSGLLVRLNGLRDERNVPTHRPLKIPIEWMSPDFLVGKPGSTPGQPPAPRSKKALAAGPLHVILDPGHGGVDPGAVYGDKKSGGQVYEHEVVYDVALRLARILVSQGVKVYLTVVDGGQPLPVTTLSTKRLGKELVRVTPPYRIDDTDTGVNMRVFLIDALFRRLTGAGVAPDNIMLLSIHGDALAPTLRGAMAYYPDRRLRLRQFNPRGRAYRLRREAVPAKILFSRANWREVEEGSQAFAETVMASLKTHKLRVASRRPVRSYYYREGERTLPAVLRYSRVPASVLVEIANLNNPEDLLEIRRPEARELIARALADAIRRNGSGQVTVASAKKAG